MPPSISIGELVLGAVLLLLALLGGRFKIFGFEFAGMVQRSIRWFAGLLGGSLLLWVLIPARQNPNPTTKCSVYVSDKGWTIFQDATDSSHWTEKGPEGVSNSFTRTSESTDWIFMLDSSRMPNVYLRVPKRGGMVVWKGTDIGNYNSLYDVTCERSGS